MSKDEFINEFVVPKYKVYKENYLDLVELFYEGLRKTLRSLDIREETVISDYIHNFALDLGFETSDYIGVFNYVLELSTLSMIDQWNEGRR